MSHDDLLAAIGAALGLDGPYTETPPPGSGGISLKTMSGLPAGAGLEVLGGTVDAATGRVAWVEEVTGEPVRGIVPVDLTINVAGPGLPRVRVDVQTYNPYFGCHVHGMGFFGDALVVLYTEKHDTIAARVDLPSGEQSLAGVGGRCALIGDLVCHVPYGGDRVEILAVPDFTPCVPLPLGEDLEARLPGPGRRGRPDGDAVHAGLRRAFAEIGMGDEDADILIGTAAVPFLHISRTTSKTYGHLAKPKPGAAPWWFPVAWHHHLTREGRPSRWPEWLDALAAPMPAGWQDHWDVDEGAVELTLAHISAQAAEMAAACHERHLPAEMEKAWKEGWRHPLPIEAFPAGFRRAWNRLPGPSSP
ncbi:hypothetical protein [Actinomadura rugatobispora]|uniref:Uncharacterized protein n=1 Tax=Actinomadura rugatobispora TaxID=1994 RepID=A0ABW0ZRV9_9ACTN|nr:hypothetical protein GCM10010200_028710 [Actinomadura rugatobispora]